MENIGANKTLGDLSWEELLEATSTETLQAERLRDQASFAGSQRMMMNDAYEETIHQEKTCEYCGEKNILTNISQYHKDGKCVERKKMIENMKNDYEGGMPLLQVAKKYDYSYTGLERIFIEEGIEIKSNKKLTKEKVWEMLDLIEEGISKNKVAQMYGISYAGLHKITSGKTWVEAVNEYKNN